MSQAIAHPIPCSRAPSSPEEPLARLMLRHEQPAAQSQRDGRRGTDARQPSRSAATGSAARACRTACTSFAGARTLVQRQADLRQRRHQHRRRDAPDSRRAGDRQLRHRRQRDLAQHRRARARQARYSPRSTVLLDGVPLAVAPYGQPQLSFAPVSSGQHRVGRRGARRRRGALRPAERGRHHQLPHALDPFERAGSRATSRCATTSFGEGGAQHHAVQHLPRRPARPSELGLALLYSGIRRQRAGASTARKESTTWRSSSATS